MKRFLSMLATLVLVGQSVVTPVVYATEGASENEEFDSTPVVETADVDEDADEGADEGGSEPTTIVSSEVVASEADDANGLTEEIVQEVAPVVVPEEKSEENFVESEVPTVEESAVVEDVAVVEDEPETDSEEIEEFDFQPLIGLNALTLKLFAVSEEPEQSDFDKFIEKWNNVESCETTENQAGCVDKPQQKSIDEEPDEELEQGEVGMWKLVQPTDNPGEYEISIAVKGKDKVTTGEVENKVCAVVVIDKSSSMKGTKWDNAKKGAISFSQSLVNVNKKAYIGLVVFDGKAEMKRGFSPSALKDSDFGRTGNGTNIHDGLIKANSMFGDSSVVDCGDAKKYIVLLGDGEPYSAVDENGNVVSCQPRDCGVLTTGYANTLKSSIEIFSIGYQTNSIGNDILQGIASTEKDTDEIRHFYTGDTSSVATAFENIATSVIKSFAGTNAHVDDDLGATITISNEGEDSYDIGNITEEGHVHTFIVRIDPTKEGNQETNAGAILTYTDVDSQPASKAITDTASVNWVLPSCGGEKPGLVDGISLGNDKFTQSWGDDGKLTPESKDWEYTESTTLGACEWTCDTTKGYVREGDTCVLSKHEVTIDPNCEGEDCNPTTTGDVEHGTKITLPTLERKYTLTYEENEKVESKLSPVVAEAELLGYCKNAKECEEKISAGTEVEITDDVTYYAVWNETPLTVTLEDGNGYTTPEYKYNFKEWQNKNSGETVSESITLTKDETLVAKYTSEAQKYTVTYKVDGETYGDVDTVVYGTELTPRDKPSKTGYTFSGWSEIPTTMPAEDVVIEGTFEVNSYTLTYMVDGKEYKTETLEFGSEIRPEAEPTKEGYTFSGWSKIPETMPAEDVVIEGTFIANSDTVYSVEYYFQNVEGTDYVLDESKTESNSGTTDTEASVTPEEISGFTLNAENSVLTGIISAEEELVLKVYYDRVESSVMIDPNCDDENEVCDITTETGSYEKEVTLPEKIRSYTLSYKVPEGALEVDSQMVTATVIGYCKGESDDCDESERISVGTTVEIEAEPVTYTAVWSNDMTVTVAEGSDYQTDSTVYTFNTWKDGDKDIEAKSELILTSDKELVADYTESARTYTVIFVDEDGETQLQSSQVAYDTMPEYTGETPTKQGETGYVYTFSGWNPEIVKVSGDARYTATYKESCDTGYHYEGVEGATAEIKICVSDETTIGKLCGPLDPESNQVYAGGDEDTVVEYDEQNGWNEKENCEVQCASEFHEENGSCVPDTQEGVETLEICGKLDENNNTHYVLETQTINYVSGARQKDCRVTCNGNYHPVNQTDNQDDNDKIINLDGVVDGTVGTTNQTTNETTENDGISGADDYMTYRCEIDTFEVTFDSKGGSTVTGQIVEYNKTATKPADPTKTSNTFQGWTLDGQVFDFLTPITQDITLVAQWKSNGGGGGGGSSGGGKTPDDCPNGDNSGDLYDGKCDAPEQPGGDNGGGGDGEEEIELGGQVSDKCSVEGSNRSEEEKEAYLYACENDITTIRDIEKARLGDFLTRAEMAKMISVFATKELGMKPNTSKDCSNFANSIASYNQEMKDYMVMACQLEIMGIHTTNYEAIPDFMPNKRVSRAEFGTVLSRILWGNKYEGTNSNYYINHLNALKENSIITNINPNITEYRAWVFLMLYRSVEAIKAMKTNTAETVEEQVNEELQEEGKAETGLVVEYDSGSVVPDMATITDSGTLATGAVAEVETGSVIESQTGDAEVLTGDDISKEVSDETGSVVETGSTGD